MVSASQDSAHYEEVSMPTSLGNNKPTDQEKEGLGMFWLAALIIVLVLAIAGFVGIIF